MDKDIPNGHQDMTTEFLTDALCKRRTIDWANVKSFRISALDNEQAITGSLVRVVLFHDQQEVHHVHWFQIQHNHAPRFGKFCYITLHYEQEIRFYEKLSNRVNLRTPQCYYSDIDIEASKIYTAD